MAVVLLLASTALLAVDVRFVTGGVLPSGEKTSTATGVEMGFLTSPRSNGIVYSLKLLGMLNDFKVNDGGFVAMDFEFIYRASHKAEPYLLAGGVYQSINDYDNAYGWEAGIGMRYVWCSGFQIGIEGKGQQMTYQSGQPDTSYRDGELDTTVVLNAYAGWRF